MTNRLKCTEFGGSSAILLKRIHLMKRKSAVKNEDTFKGLRRYLQRPTKVSSEANEGIFIKMAVFFTCNIPI